MSKRTKQVKQLPPRSRVRSEDTWDLSSLFASDAAWEEAFRSWQAQIENYDKFRGRLAEGPKVLAECLEFDLEFDRQGERIGIYAFLKTTEDQANSDHQALVARFQNVATRAGEAASYIRPELTSIPAAKMNGMLAAKLLAPYRLMLERVLRYKKHTLSKKEEVLLAMQGEMAQAANHAFDQLLDADMKFGTLTNEQGERVELSNSNFGQLLRCSKRSVRKAAFHLYYEQFKGHENTLTATLNGAIQKDIYYARARRYDGTLAATLFADNVPHSVYDNLIASVRSNLPALHRYYDLRRRKMRLKEIHHYDTYVPILSDLDKRHTWKQATKLVVDAIEPLGDEYRTTLEQGLTSARWCDRYPNRGKQSGAFSCGSYDGAPYILMNYKPEVLDDVFTLAHEAGHSMHSHYSAANQPFQYYNYAIFVAEVASTFNEQLLSRHLMERAKSDEERAYLINREVDAIRATVIRQTMFAEFEKTTHAMAEAGEPLTTKAFRSAYRELLKAYFGPNFAIDDELELECLRIPHFYRAFYVYKYATGLSAAIALSERVLSGGEAERQQYLGFLKAGCSKWPLDLLRDAGVDMASPEPVDTALQHFERLVEELDDLL